ncbi:RTA1 like protein-domain-containing protein [Mycena pura]|uniref:RTA1 like protein-domain-containing protein n=1 Tax=Mycena pura TaxID=153505 RepID=A0AAD6YM91_9AGAR|nr:RTA1 like protein-domain-containing protein [Mycena pura]
MDSFYPLLQPRLEPFNPYHYVPTKWILLHLGQAIRYRTWWLLPTAVLAGILEVTGWAARLWSSFTPLNLLPFKIQIAATIVGPTPLIAADFIILGRVIRRLGTGYSRLSPRLYSIIFCSCDIISLCVQAFGALQASAEIGRGENPEHGGHIMLLGICFQMAVLSVYILLAGEFFARYFFDAPVRRDTAYHVVGLARGPALTPRLRIMLAALAFNTTCLLIRAIYRTLELQDGFAGRIVSTQRYFNWLDGAMITLAIFTFNFVHPGIFLAPQDKAESDIELRMKDAGLLYHRL